MTAKKIIILINVSMLIFFISGCTIPEGQPDVSSIFGLKEEAKPEGDPAVAKRFEESAPKGPTAVESAVELSGKYAKLCEEAAVLRQENQNFLTKNQQLKDQVDTLGSRLQQTQKELNEANDLLIEMRIELNNWKTDIMGFRDEMRQADTEQLHALIRILEVLGGEVMLESTQQQENQPVPETTFENSEGVSSVALSTSDSARVELESKIIPTLSEPNE